MPAQSKIQRGAGVTSSSSVDRSNVGTKDGGDIPVVAGSAPQAQIRSISDDAMQFTLEHTVQLKAKLFTKCLSGAPSGSAPGPVDAEVLQLLRLAAPEETTRLFMMASMTALRKSDGGVRGNVLHAVCRTHIGPSFFAGGREDVCAIPICTFNAREH